MASRLLPERTNVKPRPHFPDENTFPRIVQHRNGTLLLHARIGRISKIVLFTRDGNRFNPVSRRTLTPETVRRLPVNYLYWYITGTRYYRNKYYAY